MGRASRCEGVDHGVTRAARRRRSDARAQAERCARRQRRTDGGLPKAWDDNCVSSLPSLASIDPRLLIAGPRHHRSDRRRSAARTVGRLWDPPVSGVRICGLTAAAPLGERLRETHANPCRASGTTRAPGRASGRRRGRRARGSWATARRQETLQLPSSGTRRSLLHQRRSSR